MNQATLDVVSTAIQSVNLLQEIVRRQYCPLDLMDEILQVTSAFPRELEEHDRAILSEEIIGDTTPMSNEIRPDRGRDRHKVSQDNLKQAIQTIMHEVNGGSRKEIAQAIYEAVSSDHRTLQQSFWSAMLLAQIEYATNPYDGRNEQAVKLANLVKDVATKNNFDLGLAYI